MRIRIFRCSHPGMLCRWKTICSTTFRRDYCTVLQHRSCVGSSKTWEELVDQAAADGGVQFDATSIYYDLGFVRACGGYILNIRMGHMTRQTSVLIMKAVWKPMPLSMTCAININ